MCVMRHVSGCVNVDVNVCLQFLCLRGSDKSIWSETRVFCLCFVLRICMLRDEIPLSRLLVQQTRKKIKTAIDVLERDWVFWSIAVFERRRNGRVFFLYFGMSSSRFVASTRARVR